MNLREKNEQEEKLQYVKIHKNKYGSYEIESPIFGGKTIAGSLDECHEIMNNYQVDVHEDSPISLSRHKVEPNGSDLYKKITKLIKED